VETCIGKITDLSGQAFAEGKGKQKGYIGLRLGGVDIP
jgi:hypothetical protein